MSFWCLYFSLKAAIIQQECVQCSNIKKNNLYFGWNFVMVTSREEDKDGVHKTGIKTDETEAYK